MFKKVRNKDREAHQKETHSIEWVFYLFGLITFLNTAIKSISLEKELKMLNPHNIA